MSWAFLLLPLVGLAVIAYCAWRAPMMNDDGEI